MAKHRPKKKEAPKKPDSSDFEKKDLPPTEPITTEDDKERNNRQLKKLYWLRVILAIIAGTAATFIFEDIEGEERRWSSIGFMIVIFFATIMVAKSMKMQLPRSDRKKIVTKGIGSYIFMYLFTWILTFTLVNVGSISNGIPSPIS